MNAGSYIPSGFHTVNPYLIVNNAAAVIDFLKTVFDAEERMRFPTPEGGIAHAEVQIGDSIVEIADATSDWPAMPASLHIYVPEIDATYQKAVAAGAEVVSEPKDQFYGERSASVRDAGGNVWHIATKTEDLTLEEINRRVAEAFGGEAGDSEGSA